MVGNFIKKILRAIIIFFVMLFAWPFFLYKKYGNKDYELTGNTVIVSNHYATLDAFFIYMAFHKRKIRFVTVAEVKKNLISCFLAWLFDCLYVDYEKSNLAFFKECIKILKDGGVLCIYPEGVINPRKYGLFTFEEGFVYIAQKADAKILPLFVYPKYKPFRKSIVYIGDVVTQEEYSACATREAAALKIQLKISEYSSSLTEIGVI